MKGSWGKKVEVGGDSCGGILGAAWGHCTGSDNPIPSCQAQEEEDYGENEEGLVGKDLEALVVVALVLKRAEVFECLGVVLCCGEEGTARESHAAEKEDRFFGHCYYTQTRKRQIGYGDREVSRANPDEKKKTGLPLDLLPKKRELASNLSSCLKPL